MNTKTGHWPVFLFSEDNRKLAFVWIQKIKKGNAVAFWYSQHGAKLDHVNNPSNQTIESLLSFGFRK
jgi:hypothetical protein